VEDLLLQVDVNDQRLDETILALRTADGKIEVQGESLDHWRLLRPDVAPRVVNGASYYPLDAIPGLTYMFDFAKQRLAILAPAAAFRDSQFVNQDTPYPKAIPSAPGGFFNYDLFASRSAGASQYSGQFEAGFFNPYGVLLGNFLEQDISGARSTIRLDTTWTSDFPEKLTTLRIGDANSVPGAWGRSVHFGGVQYGTNFATQPGFISFPSIAANGQAALPSTVDVFVNNALVAQLRPSGPFSITNIPRWTAAATCSSWCAICSAASGSSRNPSRQRESAESRARQLFGRGRRGATTSASSSDYSSGFASGTYRRGLTDFFTGEVRGEVERDFGVVGVGADYLIDEIGV
jgi:outer membrane usher protein